MDNVIELFPAKEVATLPKDSDEATGLQNREKATHLILRGEPIQWHLSTSMYDVCPKCGGGHVAYFSRRERGCWTKNGCGTMIRLTVSPKQWFEQVTAPLGSTPWRTE